MQIRYRLIFPGDHLRITSCHLRKKKRNDLSSLVLNMHNNGLGLSFWRIFQHWVPLLLLCCRRYRQLTQWHRLSLKDGVATVLLFFPLTDVAQIPSCGRIVSHSAHWVKGRRVHQSLIRLFFFFFLKHQRPTVAQYLYLQTVNILIGNINNVSFKNKSLLPSTFIALENYAAAVSFKRKVSGIICFLPALILKHTQILWCCHGPSDGGTPSSPFQPRFFMRHNHPNDIPSSSNVPWNYAPVRLIDSQ